MSTEKNKNMELFEKHDKTATKSYLKPLLGLRWMTKREKSGTVWQLIDHNQMTGVIIFKSHLGYVLGKDEHPTFKNLDEAKDEGIKRYKEEK